MSCDECNVIALYVMCCSVNRSVCVVCLTLFVNCLVKQFAISLGVVVILLLCNGLVWFEVLCWIDHAWSSKERVCVVHVIQVCVCMLLPFVYVCRKLSSFFLHITTWDPAFTCALTQGHLAASSN